MTMKFSFELPTHRVEAPDAFVSAMAIAEISREAEAQGFGAVHVTDHPAPDAKWLDHGGHHALDPFVALSFAAAYTTTLKLLTNIYIAAYRNPFLGAKSIHSLDVLSAGRLIMGTGAGYLKPEFRALGIDFDARGQLLDEALDVLQQLYSGGDIAYEGSGFSARGVRLRPLAIHPICPPIWVGGNSKAAVRRAVSRHDGWAPFNTFGFAAASRTARIDSLDDLADAVAWARDFSSSIGREAPLDICFSAGGLLDGRSLDEQHATLSRLESLGVSWVVVSANSGNRDEVLSGLRSFASRFIQPTRTLASQDGGV